MRLLAIFLLFLTFQSVSSQELAQYKWQNRLVILVSLDLESASVEKQASLFHDTKKAMTEREMLLLRLSPDSKELEAYNISWNYEGVLLIGKDGGLKAKYDFMVTPSILFELVDSMPMRRSEIRSKND
ncbi:DUF4174 domain-containing protein [Flagellimonas sp. HMM57]|uniref:DUF4174 domain-containing protein n=1 Tax=unclassified Flagellimonas TaxID=2644544 RepID=UPI0013D14646|nr:MULTISPECIES: DUF4174 domain-containing protein [unclassified Flagellimonas]UII76673.1 DUF4174 domain-containing protein [Flagellimonas sp. HMM57]